MTTPESAIHDYEPGDDRQHPMASEPPCRICGLDARSANHR